MSVDANGSTIRHWPRMVNGGHRRAATTRPIFLRGSLKLTRMAVGAPESLQIYRYVAQRKAIAMISPACCSDTQWLMTKRMNLLGADTRTVAVRTLLASGPETATPDPLHSNISMLDSTAYVTSALPA